MHPLDRPVWESLTTHQSSLSEGSALARRFVTDVNLFASARDDTPEALAALADLVKAGQTIYLAQVPDIVVPSGFDEVKAAKGFQMIAARPMRIATPSEPLLPLSDVDAPEMLALAQLTEPGPFLARTHTMGNFL